MSFPQKDDPQDDPKNADRQVDEENQLPAQIGHYVAAQGRSKGRGQQDRNAESTHGGSPLVWGGFGPKKGTGHGRNKSPPLTLDHAGKNQHETSHGRAH